MRVAICIDRSIEMVVGLLGILKTGAAYVPMDAGYPRERLSFMLEDGEAQLLITQRHLVERLPEYSGKLVCIDGEREKIRAESREDPGVKVDPANLAYVIYTSGSTGKPKGVMIHHEALSNYLCFSRRAYGVEPGATSITHSPVGFDLTVTSLYTPLVAGGSVMLVKEQEGIEGLRRMLEEVPANSLLKMTPTHMDVLSREMSAEEVKRAARVVVVGGEALSKEVAERWASKAGGVRIINEYGPTETVVGCCVYEYERQEEEGAGGVAIGKAIANAEVYVLGERMEVKPVGVAGEVYISGVGVGRGYLGRAELTAERYVPNPYSKQGGGRMYRSGDKCRYREDGNIEYIGRRDRQVKVRGYRIELGEIEAAMCEQEGVTEAAVELREDRQGNRRLVGYVVMREGEQMSGRKMREVLRQRLPE